MTMSSDSAIGHINERDHIMATHSALVINGPNLDQLGTREPEIYGAVRLADIESICQSTAKEHNIDLAFMQSNAEAELIEAIHTAAANASDAIIINAGGLTHTSIALRDALQIFEGIKIEIHLSNIFAREKFRHHSYLADIADGVICGFGADSYRLAIRAVAAKLS